MGLVIGVTALLVGTIALLVVLKKQGKAKPVQGWSLFASIWIGAGIGILGTKFLRPEMDAGATLLMVVPVLCTCSFFALFRKKKAVA